MENLAPKTVIESPRLALDGQRAWIGTLLDALGREDVLAEFSRGHVVQLTEPGQELDPLEWFYLSEPIERLGLDDIRRLLDDHEAQILADDREEPQQSYSRKQ